MPSIRKLQRWQGAILKKVMTVTYGSGRREIPINDTPEEIYGTSGRPPTTFLFGTVTACKVRVRTGV